MLIKIFLLLILCVVFATSVEDIDHFVEYQCVNNCPSLQNRSDSAHYDYACDNDCNIAQCEKGCKLWKRALNVTCQKACVQNGLSDRLTPKDLYCVMGCNDAMTKYFQHLKQQLGLPPAPALVADSLGATSLKLEWNFPDAKKAGLSCHVQWKYEELSAVWQHCRNITWESQGNIVYVDNLQPYTKYRFRIAIILDQHREILSAPSVVISTQAQGVPTSPPLIVRAAPVDHSSISVSWEPGPFPHGPLLSYVLQITDDHPREHHSEVKDIPPENNFYMFHNLKPHRNYNISVSMRNNVGAGPPARVLVTTPTETIVKHTQQPVLILGTEYSVIQQGASIIDEPMILFSINQYKIKGMGIHINKKLMFISDSRGKILKISMNRDTDPQIVLNSSDMDFLPLDITVDWLNDQLYILGQIAPSRQQKYQIVKCDLNGEGLTVAVGGLNIKPSSIEIDPYNGYLFWVIQEENRGGLYRLDLTDISNGIKHEKQPKMIINETNLGAFLVDHNNFHLLVSYQKENTIKCVSLDGQEKTDIRSKVTKSKLQKVVSLAYANKKFYWTDGKEVFYEEYHKIYDNYFHNSYPSLSAKYYKKVFINLPSSQPIPVPVNPPTNVQAIFGCTMAKTTWLAPHLLGVQGKGAWQNWSYEISVTEVETGKTISHRNINSTYFTVNDLKENTEYVIKAAAYTSFGKGPWSTEFKGMTLSESKKPIILWSAAEGLLKSDAAGENVETIMKMKSFHFIDVTWFKDQIFLVTNTSEVHWYNTTSHEQGILADMDSVGSISVDWIGKKLYWSNPKQQLIIRGNLNGTQKEHLPILTVAKELNIDSMKAYMYWSTGYAVECAHLNGEDHMVYHLAHYYKPVLGLTLDMDSKNVYWIVTGSKGSNLYRAPMAGYGQVMDSRNIMAEQISTLQKTDMQGPLCYFHKRLLWLQDSQNAAISDLDGKNIATINGKSIWGLKMVYVVDSSLHVLPDDVEEELVVIPESVEKNSVDVIGSSNSFNISWKPVENVNYGTVFYEVQIDNLSKNYSVMVTTTPSIKYWQEVSPHTSLQIAIRAFTYWGTSNHIRTKIYSPSSTPSMPTKLRTYVTILDEFDLEENKVTVTFRWNPPSTPNGEVLGYKVYCWSEKEGKELHMCLDVMVENSVLEYQVGGLAVNETYYFQVRAFTSVGDGTLSNVISVNSSHAKPLPTLLVSTNHAIYITDNDTKKNRTLISGISKPLALTYLARENKVIWVNKYNELRVLDITTNKTKIVNVKGTHVTSITIDWLERSIYYLNINKNVSITTIYKLDLNMMEKNIVICKVVYETKNNVSKIQVSPFTKKLYWLESQDGVKYDLLESKLDGTEITSFFYPYHDNTEICNCPKIDHVGSTFTLDHSSKTNHPAMVFVDENTNNIILADKIACKCEITDTNFYTNFITDITSDFDTIFWLATSEGLLYSIKRNNKRINYDDMKNVDNILFFGNHTQIYPEEKCLTPEQVNNLTVTTFKKSSSSLTITMPDVPMDPKCLDVSLATAEYKVYYLQIHEENSQRMEITTFNKSVVIEGLKPFTDYSLAVSVRNYFTKDEDIITGPWKIQKTAPGAPSRPQNVSATVLNPTLAQVEWLPPEKLNGRLVHYEIHWQTHGFLTGFRQKGEQPVLDYLRQKNSSAQDSSVISTLLTKLAPNETYTVWVRAYSETNETSNDSEIVTITTYPEPESFILLNKTAYSLTLSWAKNDNINKYTVEYSPITSNEWNKAIIFDGNNTILVKNLKPKTMYKFRLNLLYKKYSEWYTWPSDSRFTFETKGDRPSPPGQPIIQYVQPTVYKLWWEAAKDNGSPIKMYMVEGQKIRNYRSKRSTNRTAYYYTAPSIEEEESKWDSVYNGTNTSWIITGLTNKYKYAFRVIALNSYGWSNPSNESTEFDLNAAARMEEKQNHSVLVMVVCGPLLVMLLVFLCFCYGRCGKPKKIQQVIQIPRGPDVELATLRELPRNGIHNTNILYVSTQPTPEEITLLPHIRRNQITLTKFLGSGAFGEVFEGKAKGILNNNKETKVAVKTLRKGASDQEKSDFLQEAQLMSHFKHEHILQLLGVCLDNDPHFIIMELMQGGDLLTYLRSSRNQSNDTPNLSLIELLKMCVDVSKGCRYLEEMHFVHRDLACRNCLVSSCESESRIVKIGDFGLARDIYKNDYYRKEGEGLLPVRWMAPESLVDGVFTSQSDVWAFGVLLWEIMTLGQQPYPARNNLEVLHYVRRGGRLGKPTDCPEELHNLMLKCWEFAQDKRPTFKYALEVLENLHLDNLRNPITGAHEGQYISTVPDLFEGISNAAYFRDENHNSSGNSWKQELLDDEATKEKTPFLSTTAPDSNPNPIPEIPKYLELVYEPETQCESSETTDHDGYEVPNQILKRLDSPRTSIASSSRNSNCSDKSAAKIDENSTYHNMEKHTAF